MSYTATVYSRNGNPRLTIKDQTKEAVQATADKCVTRTDEVVVEED